jgi:CheY-like chemotaxis protein
MATPAVILLDLTLPDGDGVSVCRELRRAGRLTPMIMLTARADEGDKVLGLKAGVDDYVTKPYGARELRPRIAAVLRRSDEPTPPAYRFGDVEILPDRREVRRAGEPVHVKPLEFKLLMAFVENRGRALSRQQLIDTVWGRLETEQLSSLGPGIQKDFSPDGRYLYRGVDGAERAVPARPDHEHRRGLPSSMRIPYRVRAVARRTADRPLPDRAARRRAHSVDLAPRHRDAPTPPLLENFPTSGDGRLRNMLTWSRDGRYLFYVTVSPSRVWRVPVDGGPAVETGIIDDYAIGRINTGPDGRLGLSVTSMNTWRDG